MMCTYCRANNEEDAHRCHRCGRRVGSSGPVATPASYTASRSALATNLSTDPASAPEPKPAPALHVVPPPAEPCSPARGGAAIQASLFGPLEVTRPAAPTRTTRPPAQPKPRRERIEHPTFDFESDAVRTLKTSVAASIYSDAPVALASYRSMAAIIDTTIGVLGGALFIGVFQLAGYGLEFDRQTVGVIIAATAIISLLYRVLFCLGNGDTIGLLLTDLRLVDFYGRVPKRRDRLYRLAGGCLSSVAIGMGLLWAIFDEEHLTWHDHMSKTYPTMAHQPQHD